MTLSPADAGALVGPGRVILIGFMGSGKTTVGRIVAELLGWELVDTDALVEERARATVADIFRDRGESAFRALETEALSSLRERRGIVVATGGGAPAHALNRGFFEAEGCVFHLRVSLEAARARAGGGRERPLLALEERALRSLYESRLPIYEALGTPVDTEGREPRAVAEDIVRAVTHPSPGSAPADSG